MGLHWRCSPLSCAWCRHCTSKTPTVPHAHMGHTVPTLARTFSSGAGRIPYIEDLENGNTGAGGVALCSRTLRVLHTLPMPMGRPISTLREKRLLLPHIFVLISDKQSPASSCLQPGELWGAL